ncbi:MAG: SDR family oxidoreductase [Candidatus Obscuribacterales bacterium]|nr:SDR family oxidoreductase [Candidatus Obscuribacterales bacterium]
MRNGERVVFVTGGAGYVGSALIPKLLEHEFKVKVLDLYMFGDDALSSVADHVNLVQIKGDIRDEKLLKQHIPGCTDLIHLACISNDPCFEMDPQVSKSINYDAFQPLVAISKECGISRFIYASTSSVYGVSEAENVTEDHPLIPITDYNKYKGLCEPVLFQMSSPEFTTVAIRPATVCGYAPRQRLDLTVNILTNHAINTGRIKVFGGEQMRPNIHIQDMVDLYLLLLDLPAAKIAGKVFNAGFENHRVKDLAAMVKTVFEHRFPERKLEIETVPSQDIRSYRICSDKIRRELGFLPKRSIEDAVNDLIDAFQSGKLPNSMNDARYFNIKQMQEKQRHTAGASR